MEYCLVGISVFVGVVIHAAVGFGGALIAMPVLVLIIGMQTAVPVIALSGAVMTVSVLLMGWKDVDFHSVKRILLGIVFGAPLGVWLLKAHGQSPILQAALGGLIVIFALFLLFSPKLKPLKSQAWPVGFGFVGGLSGAAFSIGGPPLIIYGTCQQWRPSEFRASLQAAFICMGLITIPGHFAVGFITKEVLLLVLLSLPITGIGLWVGNWLHKKIPPGRFDRIVRVILLIMGLVLLIRGIYSTLKGAAA